MAQFWSSTDPAYVAWFLKRFRVDFVWREGRELPSVSNELLVRLFTNDDVELSRVDRHAVEKALRLPMSSPEAIPLGGRGQQYFGSGWSRDEGSSTHRLLPPGRARLYLPFEGESFLELTFERPPNGGELLVNGAAPVLAEDRRVRFALAPRGARGLQAIDVEWRGSSPLVVSGIRTGMVP